MDKSHKIATFCFLSWGNVRSLSHDLVAMNYFLRFRIILGFVLFFCTKSPCPPQMSQSNKIPVVVTETNANRGTGGAAQSSRMKCPIITSPIQEALFAFSASLFSNPNQEWAWSARSSLTPGSLASGGGRSRAGSTRRAAASADVNRIRAADGEESRCRLAP